MLAVAGALSVFGLAQLLGTSGFLATYIAALIVGAARYQAADSVERFLESLSWLAQIVLFLMLGLLVTPHDLPHFIPVAVTGAMVLIFLARPIAVMPFLLPLGFTWRESAFASWVGLRGAVPIYISFLPALVDPSRDEAFFAVIFVLVVTSLVDPGMDHRFGRPDFWGSARGPRVWCFRRVLMPHLELRAAGNDRKRSMIDKRVASVAEALHGIADGATILLGGFGDVGAPPR